MNSHQTSATVSTAGAPSCEVPTSSACSSDLTIGEAIKNYTERGENAIHKGYRDVIKSLVNSGYPDAIKNDSYADALFLTDIMFEHANKTVKIFTGGGVEAFVATLMSGFTDMLDRVRASNGSVQIISLGGVVPPSLQKLMARYVGTLKVAAATISPGAQVRHFIVCDDKMLRVEEPHGELTPATPATDIKAEVYFDNPAKGKFFSDLFDTIWKKVGV